MSHHWRDGWYFNRAGDGAVVVDTPFGISLQIPPAEWCSIMAAVSHMGETGEAFHLAERFHMGYLPETEEPHG